MAKLTDAQKAEQKKLKAIPNDKMKEAIASLNTFLEGKKIEVMPKAKSKGAAVASFTSAIADLMEKDLIEEVPEDVATFFNEFIVEEEEGTDTGADTGAGAADTNAGTADAGTTKPKKPRKTKEEIQARYDAIAAMIKTGKHTKVEIVKEIAPKFPDVKEVTIATFVQDCMNEKYNKLPKLTVKGEDGKLSFKK